MCYWNKFLISISFLLFSFGVLSQSTTFKHFGIDEGLIHPSIYNINQDNNGFLWIGTGEGLCYFDGTKFYRPVSTDTLSGAFTSCIFKDSKGNLWVGYDDGSLFIFEKNKLKKIYSNTNNPSIITSINELKNEEILFTTQSNGIYIIKNYKVTPIRLNDDKLIYTAIEINANHLIIGTNEGLWVARKIGELNFNYDYKINTIPETKINCIIKQKQKDAFWVGTSDAGLYEMSPKFPYKTQPFLESKELKNANIQWIFEDSRNTLWICTFGKGIFHLEYDSNYQNFKNLQILDQSSGLADNYIKQVFEDHEGNLWLGTYSQGLYAIMNEAFQFFKYNPNDITSIHSTNEGIWLGSKNSLIFVLKNNKSLLFDSRNNIPSDYITTIISSDNHTLWFGTKQSGIYKFSLLNYKAVPFFVSENQVERNIRKIIIHNNMLWAATNGGLFAFELKTGNTKKYSTDTDLPHNKINDVFADSKGNIWIATKGHGLYSVLTNKYLRFDNKNEIEFTAITEDNKGNLWASTYGDGVFAFMKDSVINLTERKGLKSDYGYSITYDQEGNIWVGHRLGISRINPTSFHVITYSTEIGILGDCNPHSINIDKEGNIRWGTTNGLIIYNFLTYKMQKKTPPKINITSVRILDKAYDPDMPIVLPYNKYRVRIEFIGIDFRSPHSVRYQYKLEGWDTDWSDYTSNNYAYYPRIEDGNYRFFVRAINSEGLVSETPIELAITIASPLWKRWWFITINIVLILSLIYLYIKYREHKQIKFQEYLERLLEERTREVMQQKEIIEIKNRDITDSITYAQRIQNSILPSIKKLQEYFSGSFIFYQPKDIVSGDFYWFDKISDNKFVIVCGDSTGHGVPGALMSMIGTTLIKDICNRPDVIYPSDILIKLDEEMRSTLNQNFDQSETSDGMDLIACEINLQTYQITIASAMRPVILFKNGEQIYVGGSKSSIGGIVYKNENKNFDNQTYQLSRGDLIYMFSDGYPDQFGGPLGKKYKMVRLRNLLEDIHDLPMEEQYFQIKNNFNLWKGQFDQVDDVLFMGIRL